MSIAVEDVGIADPDLVWEVTRLATDKPLREVLGPEDELLRIMCMKLALAPKDRSVDYVYCAATKLPAAHQERFDLREHHFADLIAIAANNLEPQMKRMSATLLTCTKRQECLVMDPHRVEDLLAAMPLECPLPIQQTIMTLAERGGHPYPLALALLWSTYEWTGGSKGISAGCTPTAEMCGGVPLYTFDKHTAVGKRAIGLLPRECPELSSLLSRWITHDEQIAVTLMAAFYADAAPIARRLEWQFGRLYEHIGMHADMMSAGCPFEAVMPVIGCVRRNVRCMNKLRRAALRTNLDNRAIRL